MWTDFIILIGVFMLMASCTIDLPERNITPGFVTYEIEGDKLILEIHSEEPSVMLRHTHQGGTIETEIYQHFYSCFSISIRPGSVVEVWVSEQYWMIKI